MPKRLSAKNVPIRKGARTARALQEEVNNLLRGFFGQTLPHWWRASETYLPFGVCPATDVVETGNRIKVTAELPGLNAQDIAVEINKNYVIIRGKKEETAKERKAYFRQERSCGKFERMIALPPDISDTKKAEASMDNGLLTITMPKKAVARSKTHRLKIRRTA
jgi:HSP20 family molecular chaperone IbpA